MPIAFRYSRDPEGITSQGGSFIVLCDLCHREISLDGSHNVEAEQGSDGEVATVFFLHNSCSMLVEPHDPNRPLNHSKLVDLKIAVNE